MRKMALAFGLIMATTAWASASEQRGEIELIVAGAPIEAKETADESIYLEPSVPPQFQNNGAAGGLLAQGWSLLGREDRSAKLDPSEHAWMAARLKRMTGIDPLTVAQTICRGTGDETQIFTSPEDLKDQVDLLVDHPPLVFRHGRAEWRFSGGAWPVDIPAELQPTDTPLIIEAFAEGEPFDAVPVDRIWIEPGEDIKLALKPRRYIVRALRPAKLPS